MGLSEPIPSQTFPPAPAWDQQRSAVAGGLAVWNTTGRADRVELMGEDRAKFLHNLCTADIVKLASGTGTEAFFLNAKGKIIDYGLVFATPTSLWVELEPGRGAGMVKHFDRYLFREKVTIHDRSTSHGQLHLLGPAAAGIVTTLGWGEGATSTLAVQEIEGALGPLQIRRQPRSLAGGWELVFSADLFEKIGSKLVEAGGVPVGEGFQEALRIEAGLPRYGREVTEENLAQEIGRDAQAISFVKGCYIGQETVARLDALGHVNKLLRGMEFPANAAVQVGDAVRSGEKAIGSISSCSPSLDQTKVRALAVLRLQGGSPGQTVQVTTPQGEVEGVVVPLPFASS